MAAFRAGRVQFGGARITVRRVRRGDPRRATGSAASTGRPSHPPVSLRDRRGTQPHAGSGAARTRRGRRRCRGGRTAPQSRSLLRGGPRHSARGPQPGPAARAWRQARPAARRRQRHAGADERGAGGAIARHPADRAARLLRAGRRGRPGPGDLRPAGVRRTDQERGARPLPVWRGAAPRGAPGGARARPGGQRTGKRPRTARRRPDCAQHRAWPGPGCGRRCRRHVRRRRDPGRSGRARRREPRHRRDRPRD